LAGTQQYWNSSEQHAKLSLLVDAAVSLSVQSDASRTHLCSGPVSHGVPSSKMNMILW